MTRKIIFILLTLTSILIGCQSEIKFESKKWKEGGDLDFYPYRQSMLKDIVENKRFVGLSYATVLDSLGQPENYDMKKENELWYSVTVEYGGIDPVYTNHLILTLGNDSTIEKVEAREWKKY